MKFRKQICWFIASPFIAFGLVNAIPLLAGIYWQWLKLLAALAGA